MRLQCSPFTYFAVLIKALHWEHSYNISLYTLYMEQITKATLPRLPRVTRHASRVTRHASPPNRQGCQIVLGTTYQTGKKYTQITIPNGHKNYQMALKIDEMAIKYANIARCKVFQNLPKLGVLVWKCAIWQL
jgi:hypothetical protein